MPPGLAEIARAKHIMQHEGTSPISVYQHRREFIQMKCRYTTVGGGNEGHPCSRNATKFGLCSVHLQVEYGHFYGGHRAKQKSDRCLNCGDPKSDAPVDFYCRAKPAARPLIGGAGRRRGFVAAGPKEEEEAYVPVVPEGANRAFQNKVRVIKSQDRRQTDAEKNGAS
jgi:hypothetical protein